MTSVGSTVIFACSMTLASVLVPGLVRGGLRPPVLRASRGERAAARGGRRLAIPTFVYIGRDGPRGAELRAGPVRDRHLAVIEKLDAQGRIHFAGPLRDAEGKPRGSLVILEAPDLAAARALAEADPYRSEGVFEQLDVYESAVIFPRQSSPGPKS